MKPETGNYTKLGGQKTLIGAIHTAMRDHRRERLQEINNFELRSPEWQRASRRKYASADEVEARQQAARDAFGQLNGWTITRRDITPEHIGRRSRGRWRPSEGAWDIDGKFLDHHYGCRQDGRYIALISEPYESALQNNLHQFRRWLNRIRLDQFMPPDPLASIWYPGWTLFLVIAAQSAEIRWLPEQDGRLKHLWKRANPASAVGQMAPSMMTTPMQARERFQAPSNGEVKT